MLECTPDLDLTWLQRLSKGRLRFEHVSHLSPVDVGFPCGGPRLWALAAVHSTTIAKEVFEKSTLHRFVYRSLEVDGNIFLQAPGSAIQEHEDWINKNGRKIPPHPRAKRYRVRDVISANALSRLLDHERRAAALRVADPSLLSVQFLFDMTQAVAHPEKPSGLLPRQLRNSTYWSEARNGFLHPLENLAGQGRQQCMCTCFRVYRMCLCIHVRVCVRACVRVCVRT